MPIICFGPVCIPISAVLPILIFLIKPIWERLERYFPWLADYTVVKKSKQFFSYAQKQKPIIDDKPHAMLGEEEIKGVVVVKSDEHWASLVTTSKHLQRPLFLDFSGEQNPCFVLLF